MSDQETLNMLTLASIGHFKPADIIELCRRMGGATAVIEGRHGIRDVMPDCSLSVMRALKDIDGARKRADEEIEYSIRSGIKIICHDDTDYPQRLAVCEDAPPVLFYKGTADLNRRHVIDIVGTRHATVYGQDCVRRFVGRLRELCPDTLVVSGLAYGIDICAHREALANGMDTVAVLAHGLDYLYPARHKDTARRMTEQGGLLTEHFTKTNADKLNFLRRNRIVAGMSDATVVVESASHGGGLVTARLANEYNRDVFAFPGRTDDAYSEGCNNLIRDSKATLICSADDMIKVLGWQTEAQMTKAKEQGIERSLFPELSAEEQAVVDVLKNDNDMQVNTLAATTGTAVGKLASTLFSLEMKGVVKCLAGGIYHLIR